MRAKARWSRCSRRSSTHVPPPGLDVDAPFTFLATLLDRDNFIGRILTGRVQSGTVKVNQPIHALDMDGKVIETGRASKLLAFRGPRARAGRRSARRATSSRSPACRRDRANTIADTASASRSSAADRSADAVDALCRQ
jgi:GTP-binding protein